jgi:hypothetical protein
MRFANTTSSTGNRGEGSVYDTPPAGLRQGSAGAKFAQGEVIAILTFVACAQLLTWPGPPPEAADSDTTLAEAAPLDSPRPDSSVVERGPEKAGVGGSIPSLATI